MYVVRSYRLLLPVYGLPIYFVSCVKCVCDDQESSLESQYFRVTYVVRLYGLLLLVYGLPPYVYAMVGIPKGGFIQVAAFHIWSGNLHVNDGWESIRGTQI